MGVMDQTIIDDAVGMNGEDVQSIVMGANTKPVGVTPGVLLCTPKYPHNVGAALRAASCFGTKQVWFTGDRFSMDSKKGARLPREERMKGYKSVDLIQNDYPFDAFPDDVVPVAIEVREDSEQLPFFEHPEKALYVFGPEDGSIPSATLRHCHRFVVIPTNHCTNLAAAVYITLYDRLVKRQAAGLEPIVPSRELMKEERGWI